MLCDILSLIQKIQYRNNGNIAQRSIFEEEKKTCFENRFTVSAKNIRTEKIFFKKILFLKNKYYPAKN